MDGLMDMFCRCYLIFFSFFYIFNGRLSSLVIAESIEPITKFSELVELCKGLISHSFIFHEVR